MSFASKGNTSHHTRCAPVTPLTPSLALVPFAGLEARTPRVVASGGSSCQSPAYQTAVPCKTTGCSLCKRLGHCSCPNATERSSRDIASTSHSTNQIGGDELKEMAPTNRGCQTGYHISTFTIFTCILKCQPMGERERHHSRVKGNVIGTQEDIRAAGDGA